MFRTTVTIDGMMCGMCESHVNDAVRKQINIRKVTSSHKKGTTVIISDDRITPEQISKALDDTGYKVTDVECVPYEKKGLFSR